MLKIFDSQTLNPKPETLNQKPEILNPKPETPNPPLMLKIFGYL